MVYQVTGRQGDGNGGNAPEHDQKTDIGTGPSQLSQVKRKKGVYVAHDEKQKQTTEDTGVVQKP